MSPRARPVRLGLPPKALIGMVHVHPLPGSPHADTTIDLVAAQALEDAQTLAAAGFDAVILENMHDRPYVHGDQLGPETVACMTRIVIEIRARIQTWLEMPVGVQILSGGNRQALAVAAASGAGFIRCENFTFAHVADEGLLAQAEAGPLLRYRKAIDATDIAICADIKKKHASHAITADIPIEQAAEAASFFGADALIVTGGWTGEEASTDELARVKSAAPDLPLLVGSGVNPENTPRMLEHADALIVGSAIKRDGQWSNPPDPARCEDLVAAVRSARGS